MSCNRINTNKLCIPILFPRVILPFAHGFDENVPQNVPQNRINIIIDLVRANPKIRQQDIADTLGVNVKTIKRQMADMDNVRYVGRGKGSHWEIISNYQE